LAFLFETIRLGLNNLRLHLLRSALTALGIILGVAAVIIMVSIGEGAKRAALDQIEQLGVRNIIVRSQMPPEGAQQGSQSAFITRYGLTRADVEVIENNFPDARIVPVKEVGSEVLRRERSKTSQAFGVTPQLMELAKLRLDGGRYLVQSDLDEQKMVAVIGHQVAQDFFPLEDPMGQDISIDLRGFTVVGVLAPVGLAGGSGGALIGRDLNLDVHIPITTAKSVFGDTILRRTAGSFSGRHVEIEEIYVESPSRERVMQDAARLRRLVNARHEKANDVSFVVPSELLEAAEKTAMTMNLVFGSVAGISLLVGGIGIMNIMLATVTERTREIGIRRAIGAKRKHIVWQFLVETGVLSALGGLLGIILGVSLSLIVPSLLEWLKAAPFIGTNISQDASMPTQIAGWSIILAFCVAAATGLVFGLYPALKAADQDPIVALRHD